MKNSATSPFLWFVCSFGVIPAVMFYDKKSLLIIFSIIFCIFYVFIYRSIVKFKFGKFFR
ncbi:MAG: glycosyltransferase, partial [Calditerrivibrio sp.]|nr:glycosyltransferase [Calditerrivibrio sp.]